MAAMTVMLAVMVEAAVKAMTVAVVAEVKIWFSSKSPPVTRCKAPRSRSRHDADLSRAGTDLTTEYVVLDGLAAAVAASFRTGLGTVPDRPPAATAAASLFRMPTAGPASEVLTLDRTAAVAAVSISLCPASAAALFCAGIGAAPARFRGGGGGGCGDPAGALWQDHVGCRILLEGTRSACGG